LRRPITEIQREAIYRVKLKVDIPEDLFDDGFTAAAFAARVREFAVIELVRVKRLHEHEAARMLGVERWELVEKMERAGIVPTEKEFDKIKGELGEAIASGKARIGKFRTLRREP
jgi:phage head maturation protease